MNHPKENHVTLILGSNEGNRLVYLQDAYKLIEAHIGPVIIASPIYESEAWGDITQAPHLNQVIIVATLLDVYRVLHTIQDFENFMGRIRTTPNAARTIDIDILFYNEKVIDFPELTIPHPRMEQRKFVLLPLATIAPEYAHPKSGKTMQQLLDECQDTLQVEVYNIPS